MADIILWRLALAVGLMAGGVGLYWLSNRWLLRRAHNSIGDLLPNHSRTPVLVYFTTPTCVPCKTVQRPAIEKVRGMLGETFQIVEIDATERPDLARRWGVMSVPTTFVLDAQGNARYVNNGVARADKLLKQIQAV
ncbi:MAG TPA: thioredoxin family protein [Anaerolineales bacterium]|nr:thioredoxin family protein [Anaerolineales bacterium]